LGVRANPRQKLGHTWEIMIHDPADNPQEVERPVGAKYFDYPGVYAQKDDQEYVD
jgi:hypothetical protein